MALLAGGGSAQLRRDPGTAGPVQGQQAFGSALAGARLSTALPFAAQFQVGDGQAQLSPSAAITLLPGRLNNAQTFYAPTVTQAGGGTQTLLPGLLTNAQVFYGPTVLRGAITLLPGRYDNAQSFFAPTLSPGAITLTPGRLSNTQAFYGPTVTLGAITLQPARLDNAQTFYSPTVAQAGAVLSPTRLNNTQRFFAPRVFPTTPLVYFTPDEMREICNWLREACPMGNSGQVWLRRR